MAPHANQLLESSKTLIFHPMSRIASRSLTRRLTYLLGSLLFLICPLTALTSIRARPGKVGSARSQTNGLSDLQPERTAKRNLTAHRAHSYRIGLTAGQYVRLTLQQTIDVELTIFGPDGKRLARIPTRTGTTEFSLSLIARVTGNYRVDVRSLERAASGRYELKIAELRTAIDKDEHSILAEQAFRQAELLRWQGTSDSVRSAIVKYEESLMLYRALGERSGEARVINNIGELYEGLGEKLKALDYFLELLSLCRRLSDHRGEARVTIRIGELYQEVGEMQKALEYLDMALQLNRSANDPVGEAAVLTAFGNQHSALADSRTALNVLRRALKLWRALGDKSGEAKTLTGMAKASIFRYQPQQALLYHQQALALQRITGDRRGEAHTLHGISWTYFTLGNKQKAREYNAQALSLMQIVGDRWGEAAIFTNLGWTSELSGEKQKALDFYNQALPIMQSTGDWDGEANTLYRLANVERDFDQLLKARAYIESALAVTESLRATVANQRLRVAYADRIQQYHEFYIDLLFRLHRRNPSEGYDTAAFEASERARARGLLDLLAEADVDIRYGVDLNLLNRERSLRKLITTKTDRRIRVLNRTHTELQAAEATRELQELVSSYHDLEAMIRIASPQYAALTQAQTRTLPEIQQLLDADTILLEYALGDLHTYLWVVTQNSIEMVALEKRLVTEAAASRVYHFLTARAKKIPQEDSQKRERRIAKADAEFYPAAAELSQLLLAPVASRLNTKRLVIVSDGALQYIPFSALPQPNNTDQGQAPAGYRPLILDHEIVNLPSASTLSLLRRQARDTPPKTIAIFADPVFEATDSRVSHKQLFIRTVFNQRTSTPIALKAFGDKGDDVSTVRNYLRRRGFAEQDQPLARLSYSRKEALAIASLVPEGQRNIVLDFDVNYRMISGAELGEYRFLHFATHAWLDTQEPELSGILLSLVDKEGRPQESGILRLGDIYNLNLPVELVTLSACETALGSAMKGEGLIGLTRGFMYAGAPRVVASLWKVDDVATADLMRLFYQGMLGPQKLRPPTALREAQKQMWQLNKQSSPFYWAGFVLQGEWR